MRRRAQFAWHWWSFGVRDNGIVFYLRHARSFESLRRRLYRDLNPR